MELLDNPVRSYAWGSRTAIAQVQGRPSPTAEPEAELWMGAHPRSPSSVTRDGQRCRLDAVVTADPEGELGPALVAEHGPRLPFLLKLLAAETPLSLQAHPDTAQAAAGYAAAEA
ncbi:MAG TPA: type I phosphomannose isomerase catalytic subunit, partial [Cryptosporangiaceae bacterium]|nr:type I phosphomannose isomerase catalytic subunit [Cryptosporangiaceae bacterium]